MVVLLVSVSETCRRVTLSSLSPFWADLMGVAHFLADRRDLRRGVVGGRGVGEVEREKRWIPAGLSRAGRGGGGGLEGGVS